MDSNTAPAPLSAEDIRDTAFVENVARHLRNHPQAEVKDDQGRWRRLSPDEAERISHVALRAAAPWLLPAELATVRTVYLPRGFEAASYPPVS